MIVLILLHVAPIPAGVILLVLGEQPPAAGTCDRCGYDLRGTSEESQCPECGSISHRIVGAPKLQRHPGVTAAGVLLISIPLLLDLAIVLIVAL